MNIIKIINLYFPLQFVVSIAIICITEAAVSNIEFVVPENAYAILAAANDVDPAAQGQPSAATQQQAAGDEDADSSSQDTEVSTENGNSASDADASSAAETASVSAPASVLRVKPSSAILSAIASSSGLSRSSVYFASSAQASSATASANTPLARSSATVQHRILPAETIPLPITISTRPGVRTVIAPETITIQQPTIAKVGEVVQHIPSAVSHQRQTVVHKHARVVTPIVAPAVRTVTSQIVRAYHTPLVFAPQNPTIQLVNN